MNTYEQLTPDSLTEVADTIEDLTIAILKLCKILEGKAIG